VIWAVTAAMCIAFVEGVRLMRLDRRLAAMSAVSRDSFAMVRSSAPDEEKEVAMRRASVAMLRETVMLIVGFAVIGAVLAGLFFLGAGPLGIGSERLSHLLMSPWAWLAMTGGAMLYLWIRHALVKRL
jgi:hypothetical protein